MATRPELAQAISDYWSARSRVEEVAAYRGILLYGGRDGYGPGGWRGWTARTLRRLAHWIERDW